MKDILQEIIENKRKEVEMNKQIFSLKLLEKNCCDFGRSTISMSNALKSSKSGIISEFKRRSPSKGWINQDADICQVTKEYEMNGASALSILTDNKFFGGDLNDIKLVRSSINIPILRKEFIIDEYQLYQARLIGADAVLLIAAALKPAELAMLAAKAHELGLEVLLEIHSEEELDYIDDSIDMIGVNNRNLGTFHTDTANSVRMIEHLPKDRVLVSESGICLPAIVKSLREIGYNGFLIGENFMKTDNPGKELKNFIKSI